MPSPYQYLLYIYALYSQEKINSFNWNKKEKQTNNLVFYMYTQQRDAITL